MHEFSINSISWAPHEHGLILACASSDGKVRTLQHNVDTWILESFSNDNQVGCNSISWAPFGSHDALRPQAGAGAADGANSLSARRFVTGSCDSLVRFWRFDESTRKWTEEAKAANPHTDWVRDTAWAPGISLPYNLVASCSEDKTVMIWKDNGPDGKWVPTPLPRFEQPVWRVSWSVTGNVLAVSSGNPSQPATHEVTLWKQTTSEEWVQMSKVNSGRGGAGN
jgi:protein transport protein SEC13